MAVYGSTQDATTARKGKVQLATDAETLTGTATDKVLTPSNMTALEADNTWKPLGVAWGRVQSKAGSDVTTSGTTVKDISNGGVTFTAVANRYYKVTLAATGLGTVATDIFQVDIREGSTGGSTITGPLQLQSNATGRTVLPNAFSLFTLSAGSHTLVACLARAGGTGTMRTGFAGAQTILTIEDAGPA